MVLLNFCDPEERPWPNPRLKTASIIGHTTTTSVRLWLRVPQPGDYCLVVAKNPIPTDGIPHIQSEGKIEKFALMTGNKIKEIDPELIYPLKFVYDNDLTNVVDIKDLKPQSRYYYILFQPNEDRPWILGHEEPLSFRTFPENPTEVNFGLYSCHQPYHGQTTVNLKMWDKFYQELWDANAQFVLAAGDQVYVDGEKELDIWKWLKNVKKHNPSRNDMVSWYRDIYQGYWGLPEVQRIFQSFTTYMIWDDHEIVDGWGSYTPQELAAKLDVSWELRNFKEHINLAHEMFSAAKQVYREYEHSHNPHTDPNLEQFDYEFSCGISHFYVLDMRGHHDFNRQELRLLGAEQWQRFETWLNAQYDSSARVLFIVSPVPVAHFKSFVVNTFDVPYFKYTDDFRDHWDHDSNWSERNQLLEKVFQFSQETKRPVVFLSGDVHMGAVFKISHQKFPSARVFQLTSSGISYASMSEFGRHLLENLVQKRGNLGDHRENIPYQVENLYICRHNNFGMVRVKEMNNGELSISYELFYSSKQAEGIIEMQRIELDQIP
ncbi:alkaline phosphatase D family protein [Microcoleus sp. FACHB-68]|uniref:alkaline phosphatase D family protein n=1 Tax=Microcoleus sp. FACHB-68 TaxID=2692826 RepID=UPI0016835AED|nr:alkaline phosphatase D family protein [Microcoleus sp. FACHB-68]MBD1937762.1 alkaline phosphatase family protein [Microcoleus sp. FACHB-68]